MSGPRRLIYLRVAASMTLLSSVLMVYALLFPKPLTIVLTMSLGQGIGILGVLIYFFVVGSELVARRVLRPPGHPSEPPPS